MFASTVTPLIAASLLSADFARLGEAVRAVDETGVDWIHFDVMDNHYVPNLTLGPMVCAALRPWSTRPFDVHLMVEPVDELALAYARAGANWISFHPEASRHVDRTLAAIREAGAHPALALNPATPLTWLDHLLDRLDMVLIMSVNPGFGGQLFIPAMLDKLRATRARLDQYQAHSGRRIRLEVDGGIKANNLAAAAAAGADVFVVGSALFGAPVSIRDPLPTARYRQTIMALRQAAGVAACA